MWWPHHTSFFLFLGNIFTVHEDLMTSLGNKILNKKPNITYYGLFAPGRFWEHYYPRSHILPTSTWSHIIMHVILSTHEMTCLLLHPCLCLILSNSLIPRIFPGSVFQEKVSPSFYVGGLLRGCPAESILGTCCKTGKVLPQRGGNDTELLGQQIEYDPKSRFLYLWHVWYCHFIVCG